MNPRQHNRNTSKRTELLTAAYTQAVICQRMLAQRYEDIQELKEQGQLTGVLVCQHSAAKLHAEMSRWLSMLLNG